ncbi:LexA family transcriptional regulator [Pararhodobacter sp. CCB-MM2]|uniref:helix-turn-helix domain-containing protein n=1 Tax=Pararhodobacter sp. CCB-MM2 TaxID=1786003 RepID=UPI00082C4A2D|nr:LexA family transcriptional regulator [Pararhodobacter sp. CCB-MM2]
MTVAQKITEFRKAKGLSQKELAEESGVSQQLISQIERGINRTTKHIPALARALGRTLQEIDPTLTDVIEGKRLAPPPSEPVPLISWVSAGQLTDQPGISDFADFPTVYASDLPPGRWIALRVDGTSMNKLSPPESIVIVNLDDTRLVPNRCYVVADETGAATYKAYDPKAEPQFQPRSYVPTDPPVFVGAVRVIGRVYRTMLDM